MINISSSFFELVTHSRVTTWRAYVHVVDPPPFSDGSYFCLWNWFINNQLLKALNASVSSNPAQIKSGPFFESDPRLLFKKTLKLTNPFSFFFSLSCCSNWWSHENAGPYLTGPSGYPSPDPTGMGYMMDGQQAAAAAMMHARPPGDAGYDYPHPAAAYSQYYSHL